MWLLQWGFFVPSLWPLSPLHCKHKAIPRVVQIRAGPSIAGWHRAVIVTHQSNFPQQLLDRMPEEFTVLWDNEPCHLCFYGVLCSTRAFRIASLWSFPPRSLYLLVINVSLLTTLCISAAPWGKVITGGAADDAELQLGLKLVVQGDIFQSCNISILPNYENVKLTSVS